MTGRCAWEVWDLSLGRRVSGGRSCSSGVDLINILWYVRRSKAVGRTSACISIYYIIRTKRTREEFFGDGEKNHPVTASDEEGMHDRHGQDQKGIIAYIRTLHCACIFYAGVCVCVCKGHAAATPRALWINNKTRCTPCVFVCVCIYIYVTYV